MNKKQRTVLVFGAIIVSNLLGMLSLQEPTQMSITLTALPILIVSFTMGWEMGYVAGLFGGIVQSINYGTLWYVFYTAILGGVSGYLAKNPRLNRRLGSVLFTIGVFFMYIVIAFENKNLLASELFTILISLLLFVILEYHLVKNHLGHNPLTNLTLAGCAGAAACIPYEMAVMTVVQNYGMVQLFAGVSKEVVQGYLTAIIAAVLLQSEPIKKIFKSR